MATATVASPGGPPPSTATTATATTSSGQEHLRQQLLAHTTNNKKRRCLSSLAASCTTKRQKHRRKGVTFCPVTRIRLIPTVHVGHHDCLWMSPLEIQQTKERVQQAVLYYLQNGTQEIEEDDDDDKNNNDNLFCLRGLEYIMDHLEHKKRVKKSLAVALAVQRYLKLQQHSQSLLTTSKPTGGPPDQVLAQAYAAYTAASRKLAHQRGLLDAAFVQKQQQQDVMKS